MPEAMSFEIITHAGLQFQAEVSEVLIPTPDGQIGVLPGHEPLITLVAPGVITIHRHPHSPEDLEYVATSGGFAEIKSRVVRLLADATIHASEVDESRMKEAIVKAEKLKSQAGDDITYADAVGQLELSLASLKAANLARHRHRRRRHTI